MTPWDRLGVAVGAIRAARYRALRRPDWLAATVASVGLFSDGRDVYGGWQSEALPVGQAGLWQHPAEFARFLVAAAGLRPRAVLDLGTFHGFGAVLMATYLRRFEPGLRLVAADKARWLPDPPPPVFDAVDYRPGTDSGDYQGEAFDLAFIDADHAYDAAALDYDRLRHCRAVAFHDINDACVRDRCAKGGVYALWRELKAIRPAAEFLRPDGSEWMGIGLLT